ncbi:porin [Xylophilus sp.]|uniref:porin n=1 Tax=Xylophilus sp. TaxID=2653893 RepID=UPI0013B92F3D|nr:porin [Xylophilus sp.]KAF1050277.1 MAG: Outer membrane porin protein [Xylophilus sp.]
MTIRTTFAACAAAAAGLWLPPLCHAQSSVTLYGVMDVTVRHASNAASGGGSLNTVGDGYFGGSRLGFKGSENLGGGLRALYMLEMGIDPSTGLLLQSTAAANYGQAASASSRAFGRESWVGLSSATWGALTFGRQYTLAHQAAARIQPMGNPNADAVIVLSNHHMARQDNMVKYAKEFGPFDVAGSVTLSEGNGRGSGLSAGYRAAGFDAVLYGQNLSAAAGGEVRRIRGGGAAYQIAPSWKAFLAYMTRSHEISPQRNKVATAGLHYYATPALTLTASYTHDRQNTFGTNASGRRQVAWLSADYYLSKRTDLYAAVDHNKIGGGYVLPSFMATRGSQTGVTAGVRHRF